MDSRWRMPGQFDGMVVNIPILETAVADLLARPASADQRAPDL
jgi:hypothetical protein